MTVRRVPGKEPGANRFAFLVKSCSDDITASIAVRRKSTRASSSWDGSELMAAQSWVQFFSSDWRSGCLVLSLEEEGLYIRSCNFTWDTGEPLPNDAAWPRACSACRCSSTSRSWARS